jgi:hypothetical protein
MVISSSAPQHTSLHPTRRAPSDDSPEFPIRIVLQEILKIHTSYDIYFHTQLLAQVRTRTAHKNYT